MKNRRSAPRTKNSRGKEKSGSPRPRARQAATSSTEGKRAHNPAPAPTSPPADQSDRGYRIEGNRMRSIVIAGFIIVFGVLSVYFYIGILSSLHDYYTLVFVVPLYAYVFGDLVIWLRSGIRAVAIDSSGLNIVRTSRQPERRIDRHEMKSIHISSSIDGKMADIILQGGGVRKFLWLNIYSGPHLRISQGSFAKQDFAEFLRRLSTLVPAIH